MTAAPRVLVADDEREILVSCVKILERAGYEVTTACDGSAAIERLKSGRYDLLFVDLKMPGRSGLEILTMARALDPRLAIVMFTAFATLETAVDAVKRGAFDYLAKPFTADRLVQVAGGALRHRQLDDGAAPAEPAEAAQGFDRILGTSEAMQKVFATIRKVARTDANILLQSETGTGKELLSRTIHEHSLRRDGPFVPIDCAALPETLLESELFGHEKGAFTGADRPRRGLLEQAHAGTLFLDEVGELPPPLQAKLLRTLQERELRRVGGDRTIPVDIRIIAATGRDLRAEIARNGFREDLYYRLNVITIPLPPLRDRPGDIPLLTHHFLRQFSRQYLRPAKWLTPDVLAHFVTYSWPGNIRELQNVIQHAVLLAETDAIHLSDLPESLQGRAPEALSFRLVRAQHAEAVERPFLTDLLRKHKGNVSEAAADAGMTRKMIYRLARKLGIDPAQYREP